MVGKAGFEPATSASRTLRANQAALLPGELERLPDRGAPRQRPEDAYDAAGRTAAAADEAGMYDGAS